MKAVGILVEIVEVVVLNGRLLDLIRRLVALGNLYSVADTAHFDLADGRPLAGMDVLGGQNHIKLSVLLDDVALANRTGDYFQSVFPDVLARDRSGHGYPGASEAVSGCNILILPPHASILRARFAGSERPASRTCHFKLPAFLTAFGCWGPKGKLLAMAHHSW
jgi:hypothetical protein